MKSKTAVTAGASVKGIKEKVHFPLYDSVTIKAP